MNSDNLVVWPSIITEEIVRNYLKKKKIKSRVSGRVQFHILITLKKN